MAAIKVFYFDFRGRAEVIRMVLMLAGQEFEDVRWAREDWPKYKPEAPFGQCPWLEYKGKKYGQSNAIAAFLASEFNLYGKTHLDKLRIDEVLGLVDDATKTFTKVIMEKDEQKKKELSHSTMTVELPRFFGFWEKLLQENGSTGYFVGENLTLADLYVYDMLDNLVVYSKHNVWADLQQLRTLKDKVETDPRLTAYLDKRKKSPVGV